MLSTSDRPHLSITLDQPELSLRPRDSRNNSIYRGLEYTREHAHALMEHSKWLGALPNIVTVYGCLGFAMIAMS